VVDGLALLQQLVQDLQGVLEPLQADRALAAEGDDVTGLAGSEEEAALALGCLREGEQRLGHLGGLAPKSVAADREADVVNR
jgi:hypothetical protein